jgi:hypothetical protein
VASLKITISLVSIASSPYNGSLLIAATCLPLLKIKLAKRAIIVAVLNYCACIILICACIYLGARAHRD